MIRKLILAIIHAKRQAGPHLDDEKPPPSWGRPLSSAVLSSSRPDDPLHQPPILERRRHVKPYSGWESPTSTHAISMWNYIWGEREGRSFFFTRPGGGGFRVQMTTDKESPIAVSCIFWASATGHLYDIAIEGTRIATVEASNESVHSLMDVEYEIPTALTRGKERIVVELSDRGDSVHAPVFECRIVQPKQ